MPALVPPPPPPILAIVSRQLPPLSFIGFIAGMQIDDADRLTRDAGGVLTCKGTSDPRIRECTGAIPFLGLRRPMDVLISTVRDSASVIVLTCMVAGADTRSWVRTLTEDFGVPNYRRERGDQESWEWIRRGQMLRVVLHQSGGGPETAVTLTHGPLLDGLGPPRRKTGR